MFILLIFTIASGNNDNKNKDTQQMNRKFFFDFEKWFLEDSDFKEVDSNDSENYIVESSEINENNNDENNNSKNEEEKDKIDIKDAERIHEIINNVSLIVMIVFIVIVLVSTILLFD